MTESLAREELEGLVHEYRHAREEHRRARRGSRTRRRLGAHMRELEVRFEHVLGAVPLEDATRHSWREHLHDRSAPPAAPARGMPLPAAQGASVRWPGGGEPVVSVQLRGDLPADAREELERRLRETLRFTPRPLVRARATIERLADPASARPVVVRASLDLGAHTARAHAEAASTADALDLLEARLRRSVVEFEQREDAQRRRA
ncbi:MAG TPA: hypothetical protein VFJ91_02510 [Gaiellaceae bacterium]|nr:hypothetical protein [Gaiellaceae bacterium]